MRTAVILGIGFCLLGVFLGCGWLAGGAGKMRVAALLFIAVWLLATAGNMYVGVARAGYSFMEELPIFLLLFAVPALAAVLLRWRL